MTQPDVGETRTVRAARALNEASVRVKRDGGLPKTGGLIIGAGIVMMVVEVTLQHWIRALEIDYRTLLVGGFMCFAGYFARHPHKALTAGASVVNWVGALATIPGRVFVRKGRRADDPLVEVPVITDTPSEEFLAVERPAMNPTIEQSKLDYTKGKPEKPDVQPGK